MFRALPLFIAVPVMAASTVNMPESKILVSAVSGTSIVRTRPIFGPESK